MQSSSNQPQEGENPPPESQEGDQAGRGKTRHVVQTLFTAQRATVPLESFLGGGGRQ